MLEGERASGRALGAPTANALRMHVSAKRRRCRATPAETQQNTPGETSRQLASRRCGIAAGTKGDGKQFGDVLVADPSVDYNSGKVVFENGIRDFQPDPYPVSLNQDSVVFSRGIVDRIRCSRAFAASGRVKSLLL